jgi:hypothetical protein
MYLKSKMRLLGMSALVGAGILATGSAGAYDMRLGGIEIQMDTTLSAGASVRVADRNTKFLPSVNGGPSDTRVLADPLAPSQAGGTVGNPSAHCMTAGSLCMPTANTRDAANYDGSINGDDGRLNFDNGDLTSGSVKFVSEFSADFTDNLRGFVRVSGFYDAVLADDGSYERSKPFGDAVEDEHHLDLRLLDAFVSYDTTIGDLPVMVRAGKQVINWGESTFFLGGNSVFNPIDVPAIRKPGAEIKEALLPVEAIYGSISLPYDISLEAYVGGWDRYVIDNGGTPFGSSDAAFPGSSANRGASLIGGGNFGGTGKINYDYDLMDGVAGVGPADGLTGIIGNYLVAGGNLPTGVSELLTPASSFQHNLALDKTKTAEEQRWAYDDPYLIKRIQDDEPNDFDNYGLAVRWYSEALNSTEFAFYYQNYASRIPRFGINSLAPRAGASTLGGVTTDATNRGTSLSGCGLAAVGLDATKSPGFTWATAPGNDISFVLDDVNDPTGIHRSANTNGTPLNTALTDASLGGAYISAANSLARLGEVNCRSVLATNKFDTKPGEAGGDVHLTGAMALVTSFEMQLYAEYPEEREVYGVSAATTIGGWGVQGEVTYRPNADFQIDTDTIVAGAVVAGCGFANNYGPALAPVFGAYSTYAAASGIGCTGKDQRLKGWDEMELYNFDIGTTALYTSSNPVVSFLGANSMVLLTEFAGAYVPDFETRTIQTSDGPVTVESTENGYLLSNTCTSGGDVPLSGLFGLDPRGETECRPTQGQVSGLLLAGLTYNNVLGTAWTLEPRIIHRQGLRGRGIGGVQGVGSSALSVTASYQETKIGFSFVDYFGDELRTKNGDRDTVSINISQPF